MNGPLRIGIQVVLGLAIIALCVALYYVIVVPGQEAERRQAEVDNTRQRMDVLRTALIRYEREEGRYPSTLDSLVMAMRTDSAAIANPDSVYEFSLLGYSLDLDEVTTSARSGEPFAYAVNQDTTEVPFYLLEDPASDDAIGSLSEPTRRNAATWE